MKFLRTCYVDLMRKLSRSWSLLAVLANNANNSSSCFYDSLPSRNWKEVNSDVTSFQAPASEVNGTVIVRIACMMVFTHYYSNNDISKIILM